LALGVSAAARAGAHGGAKELDVEVGDIVIEAVEHHTDAALILGDVKAIPVCAVDRRVAHEGVDALKAEPLTCADVLELAGEA